MLALSAIPAQAAAPEPLDGKWTFRSRIAGVYLVATCEFRQNGLELSGTCRDNASGEVRPLTYGSVRRDWVRFSYDTSYAGYRFKARYLGRLTDGIINQGSVRSHYFAGRMFGYRAS